MLVLQARADLLMSEKDDKTMVRIGRDTKKLLDDLVERKGETYDDIIKRTAKFYKEHKRTWLTAQLKQMHQNNCI